MTEKAKVGENERRIGPEKRMTKVRPLRQRKVTEKGRRERKVGEELQLSEKRGVIKRRRCNNVGRRIGTRRRRNVKNRGNGGAANITSHGTYIQSVIHA